MILERSNFRRPLEIAVLSGGVSAEREVSFRSGDAVAKALLRKGHQVRPIKVHDRRVKEIDDFRGDVAFIALHGVFGEDGGVQSILERRGIPYTGSGPAASRLAMDKHAAKRRFKSDGISTPSWAAIPPGIPLRDAIRAVREGPGFPAVIKPIQGGSSIGIEILRTPDDLVRRLEQDPTEPILVEEYLPGREFTVSVLGDRALPIVELRPAREFFDYQAKYSDAGTEYGNAASLSPSLYRQIQEVGLSAHRSLGCRAFSRADLILPEGGVPVVLEVNTIPGLTEKSLQPKAAGMSGVDFGDLCEEMIALADPLLETIGDRRRP